MISQPLEAQTVDESNLETFDTTQIDASDLSAHNKRGVINGYISGTNVNQPPVSQEPAEEETDETEDTNEEEDTSDNTVFSQEFEQTFGLKPKDAVELVNSLQSFRDEQMLMRQWQVSPDAYDERMEQVREFYNSLPVDGREQFNTVEGAVAIWEHLQKSGQAKAPTTVKRKTANTRVKRAEAKPLYDFSTKEIKAMPPKEYQQKLPAIVKAFQSGRVLEN